MICGNLYIGFNVLIPFDMNIKAAIFGLVSIRPSTINEVIKKLPYSDGSIYNTIEKMLKNSELIKEKTNGDFKLTIPNDYHSQKNREIYVKSLSYGIDPEYILRDNIFDIWKSLDERNTVQEIIDGTNYSEKWIRGIIKKLADYDLIIYIKKKPIVVEKNKNHIIAQLMESLIPREQLNDIIMTPGEMKYEEIYATPDEIEKNLYDKIEQSITIRNTGWLIKGGNKITIYESISKEPRSEELFILKIKTPEGIEDVCLKYLFSNKIDYQILYEVAKENNLINRVGCYLDIINDIRGGIIPKDIIQKFLLNISNKKTIFLKEEMKYGKSGWEDKYEEKWNIDLYLDIGAIQHGVRSL